MAKDNPFSIRLSAGTRYMLDRLMRVWGENKTEAITHTISIAYHGQFGNENECYKCHQSMTWKECENCKGKGWTSAAIADNDCTACHQRGGWWECKNCGVEEP